MNIPQTINAAIRRVTGYSLIRTGSTKSYNWSYLYPLGGAGVGGENHDLLRTDNGAALAQTISVAAYRAVEARRLAVGSMPWRIVNVDNGNEITTSEDPHPKHLFGVALHQANSVLGQSLFSAWEMSMIITGKAFIEPYKNAYGKYSALEWLNPTRVHINAPNGIIQSFQYQGDGKSVLYTPDEIVYERFPNLVSDVYGLSPLYVAMARINISVNTDRYLNAFFRNNGRLGQILSPKDPAIPLDELEIQQIKNQVSGAKGSDSAYKTLVTPVPFDIHYPDQVDLSKHIDMMERVETSIYTTLGVPRPVAGDVDGQRYQASPESLEWFYQNVIIPRCRDIQRLVNSDLLPRFGHDYNARFEFDTSEWERISPTRMAQLEIVERSYQNGALSLNDYRRSLNQYVSNLDIEPLEFGDIYIVPGSGIQVAAEQLGALQGKPSYITFQSPQTTIQQAGEMAQGAGINVPKPPPPETNPASEAPADVVEQAKEDKQQAENPPALASQEDALSELRTWRKYAKKHGAAKALEFDTQHLEDWQVLRVKHGLVDDDAAGAFSALESVLTGNGHILTDDVGYASDFCIEYQKSIEPFLRNDVDTKRDLVAKHALSILAQKAIQATRSTYEDTVEAMLLDAVAGNIDRRRAGNILRNATQVAIGRAYLDGLEDGGISEPELDDDDTQWVGDWFDNQRKYITSLMDAIYKDNVVTEAEIANKPAMWFVKSIQPAYYEGIASASRNAAFEWVLGNREKHCPSCTKLNGQVRRMGYWNRTVKPGDDRLACNGFNCGCDLAPTRRALSRGRLPSWKSHTHD